MDVICTSQRLSYRFSNNAKNIHQNHQQQHNNNNKIKEENEEDDSDAINCLIHRLIYMQTKVRKKRNYFVCLY